MNAAFNSMLDIINAPEEEVARYEAAQFEAIAEVRRITAPEPNIPIQKELIEVPEYDEDTNILDASICMEFESERIHYESHLFTAPISTTNTMEGYLSNVQFHESELIKVLVPTERVVQFRCNYGIVTFPGYVEPVKVRNTNRGRKKKEKKKKLRKKQGTGEHFNSQITFVILHEIGSTEKPYKFKVFRTGNLQLPGVLQHSTSKVIECANLIPPILNQCLHPGEVDLGKRTGLVNINPVMKNYKFVIKMPPNHIIDLAELRNILAREQARQGTVPLDDEPTIFSIKYSRQETNLAVKFATPLRKDPAKCTRISIFMRGKVNILGALYAKATAKISKYMHDLIDRYYKTIIVREGSPVRPPLSLTYHGVTLCDGIFTVARDDAPAPFPEQYGVGPLANSMMDYFSDEDECICVIQKLIDYVRESYPAA